MGNPIVQQEFSEFLDRLTFENKSDHKAEVLLLTCIDFRFFHLVQKYINERNLAHKFDHVILAGAELGPVVDFPPDPKLHWQQFFLEHLALAIELHAIKKLIVLGHRTCGAYEKFRLLPQRPDPERERQVHRAQAEKLEKLVKRFYPTLTVEAGLLSLEDSKDARVLMLEPLT